MQTSQHALETCPGCGQQIIVDPRKKILEALPERGYVRQKLLIPHLLPFSSATLWRKVNAGEFPAPKKLSPRITAWRIEDVREWLRDKKPKL